MTGVGEGAEEGEPRALWAGKQTGATSVETRMEGLPQNSELPNDPPTPPPRLTAERRKAGSRSSVHTGSHQR